MDFPEKKVGVENVLDDFTRDDNIKKIIFERKFILAIEIKLLYVNILSFALFNSLITGFYPEEIIISIFQKRQQSPIITADVENIFFHEIQPVDYVQHNLCAGTFRQISQVFLIRIDFLVDILHPIIFLISSYSISAIFSQEYFPSSFSPFSFRKFPLSKSLITLLATNLQSPLGEI